MARDSDPLARFAFDLHDGPLQTLAAFRRELQAFRGQLAAATAELEDAATIVGCVGDLEAWLSALDDELRDLISAAGAPEVLAGPLSDAVVAAVEGSRGACEADIDLDNGLDEVSLTDVQRVMLVRIVQAAVSNAARHSGSARLRVALRAGPAALEVEIADAGTGFDVDAAFAEAALRGRLGLVGIRHRVRLLGAELSVTSQTGRGTQIRVRVPLR